MAESPVIREMDLTSFTVKVGGEDLTGKYDVVSLEVVKEVNKVPTAKIVLVDGDPASQNFEHSEEDKFLPGAEVEISMGYRQKNNNDLVFKGIVVGTGLKVRSSELSELVIKCVDKAAKMTVERKNFYFPEQKDSDIMSAVIGKHGGLSADVEATSESHEEIIQFQSSDWDFLLSRAEANAMLVTVDDGKVTVGKPKVSGAAIKLTYGEDIEKLDIEIDARSQLPKVTTNSWDMAANAIVKQSASEPEVPKIKGGPDGKKLSAVLGAQDFLLHSSGPLTEGELKAWADGRLMKSRLSRVKGKIKFQGNASAKPNSTIELNGLGLNFNGEGYISGVHHVMADSLWTTEVTLGISEKTFSETQPDMHSHPATGLLPGISGLAIGKVKQIDADPQDETRVLVDVPVIAESGNGVWARLANFYSSNTFGAFWMPEVGDEVILGFLNGDPRYPIILGSVYSQTNVPAYTPDAENTFKAIVTKTKMKIEFEDVKSIITILTPGGQVMTYSDPDKSITIEDVTGNKYEMTPEGISVYTPKDMKFKADMNIKMEAGQEISIKAGTDLKMEGGMNVTSKAGLGNTMQGTTCEVKGSAQTTIKGGVVLIN